MTTQYGPTEQARKEKLLWRENAKRRIRKVLKIASYASTCAVGAICLIIGIKIDYIQSPIVVKAQPVIIWREQTKPQSAKEAIKPEQVVTPTPTAHISGEEAVVKAQRDGEILWKIYHLETNRGKQDYCRINGTGAAGFGVKSSGIVVCYPDFETAVDRAQYWWSEISATRTLDEALCKWSGHGDVQSCEYSVNFHKI